MMMNLLEWNPFESLIWNLSWSSLCICSYYSAECSVPWTFRRASFHPSPDKEVGHEFTQDIASLSLDHHCLLKRKEMTLQPANLSVENVEESESCIQYPFVTLVLCLLLDYTWFLSSNQFVSRQSSRESPLSFDDCAWYFFFLLLSFVENCK